MTARNADRRVQLRRALRCRDRLDVDVRTTDGKRQVVWWPNFRVIDTATVEPDLEVSAAVLRFENELIAK